MGGMMGGLHWILDSLGGSLLFLLVGKLGWRNNFVGRWARLILGGAGIGAVIGAILWYLARYQPETLGWPSLSRNPEMAFVAVAIGVLAAVALELLYLALCVGSAVEHLVGSTEAEPLPRDKRTEQNPR
jgi:hypothetical protein